MSILGVQIYILSYVCRLAMLILSSPAWQSALEGDYRPFDFVPVSHSGFAIKALQGATVRMQSASQYATNGGGGVSCDTSSLFDTPPDLSPVVKTYFLRSAS